MSQYHVETVLDMQRDEDSSVSLERGDFLGCRYRVIVRDAADRTVDSFVTDNQQEADERFAAECRS